MSKALERILSETPGPGERRHAFEQLTRAMFKRPWWMLGLEQAQWRRASFEERVALW